MELKCKQYDIDPDIFVTDDGHAWDAKNNPEMANSCAPFYSLKIVDDLSAKIRELEAALDISYRLIKCGGYQDPNDIAIDYGGTGYEKHPTVVAVYDQCAELDVLKTKHKGE